MVRVRIRVSGHVAESVAKYDASPATPNYTIKLGRADQI